MRERMLLALIFVVLPLAFILGLLLPAQRRMAALEAEQDRIGREMAELPRYSPLSQDERQLLSDPSSPWRHRIPLVSNDRERVAHYYQVITLLQQALQRTGAPPLGIRSDWEPIHASFTLPTGLGTLAQAPPLGETTAQGRLEGWVLEARFGGGVDQLFKALEAAQEPLPLLEPVGLRWEAAPEGRLQAVLFRNLVLVPSDTPAR
jgi:hypothetical protein